MTVATASPPTTRPVRVRRSRPTRLVQPVVAIALVLLLLGIPFWLVVATAGKNQAEALNPNLAPPTHWHLFENFATVFGQGLFAQATTMSLMLFLMVAVLAFPVITLLRKREDVLS